MKHPLFQQKFGDLNGWMGFILKEKLKVLKNRLCGWHKEEYGGLEVQINDLIKEIANLDERGERSLLNDEEVCMRKDKFGNLWRHLKARDSLVVQRSRVRWMKEGDANTRYFHNCMKPRASSNGVRALKVNGGWVQTPTEVRREVVDYFRRHVGEVVRDRPSLDGVPFDWLTEEDNIFLEENFTSEEIEGVVKESDGNKSPGPDGFNFAFIKEFWYLLKDEVRILFDQFHANEVIPKSLLAYFVALIPKVSSPMSMKDFCPISLLGCLYKLLEKVLARRLTKVMDSIISTSQSAFLKGRNLVDGVLCWSKP